MTYKLNYVILIKTHNLGGGCMQTVRYCPKCGNVDVGTSKSCIFCNHETFDTKYTINDMVKIIDFDKKIINEYASKSPEFDEELAKKREEEEYNVIHGSMTNEEKTVLQNMGAIPNNNILKCPKCGSTAVSTGARGFSIVTGFLGAGQTVNRCGNCGYKWKPKG